MTLHVAFRSLLCAGLAAACLAIAASLPAVADQPVATKMEAARQSQGASAIATDLLRADDTRLETQYAAARSQWQDWQVQLWAAVNGQAEMPPPLEESVFARMTGLELLARLDIAHAEQRIVAMRALVDDVPVGVSPFYGETDKREMELAIAVHEQILTASGSAEGEIDVATAPAITGAHDAVVSRFTVPGTEVELQVYDHPGGGAPVLLLHGGPGSSHYLQWTADYLNAHGRRVITFDQRGVGGSSMGEVEDFSVDALLSDVVAVQDHFGLASSDILGHSWGGLHAQLFADAYPERVDSLFLANSTAVDTHRSPTALYQRVATDLETLNILDSRLFLLYAGGFQATLRMQLALPEAQQDWTVPDDFFRRYNTVSTKTFVTDVDRAPFATRDDFAGTSGEAFIKTTNSVNALAAHPSVLQSLGEKLAGKHVTVFYGEGGDIVGADHQRVLDLFEDDKAIKIVADGVGHAPWLENPERISRALDRAYGLK